LLSFSFLSVIAPFPHLLAEVNSQLLLFGTTVACRLLSGYAAVFFSLIQETVVEDRGGHVYPDDAAAFAAADTLAREIDLVRPWLKGRGYAVVVTNGDGAELYRAPLDRAPHLAPD
jgi:hypothetical protein